MRYETMLLGMPEFVQRGRVAADEDGMDASGRRSSGESRMIDAKEATKRARDYLLSLEEERIHALQLEETELSDDERFWLITLSYQFSPIQSPKYKVFKIDSNTGRVVSMKIRSL
jgi:hypothetical protein